MNAPYTIELKTKWGRFEFNFFYFPRLSRTDGNLGNEEHEKVEQLSDKINTHRVRFWSVITNQNALPSCQTNAFVFRSWIRLRWRSNTLKTACLARHTTEPVKMYKSILIFSTKGLFPNIIFIRARRLLMEIIERKLDGEKLKMIPIGFRLIRRF